MGAYRIYLKPILVTIRTNNNFYLDFQKARTTLSPFHKLNFPILT